MSKKRSAMAKRITQSPSVRRTWWSAAALAHIEADEACGRSWQYACGACLAGRLSGRFNDLLSATARRP